MRGWPSFCFLLLTCWAVACDDSSGHPSGDAGPTHFGDASRDASAGASRGSGGGSSRGGMNGAGMNGAGTNGGAASNGGSGTVDASIGTAGSTDAGSGVGGRSGASADAGDAGFVWSCSGVNEDTSSYVVGPALSDDQLFEAFASIRSALRTVPKSTDQQAYAVAVRAAVDKAAHVGITGIGHDCTVLVRLTDGTPVSVFDETQSSRNMPPNDAGLEATDAGWSTPSQLLLGTSGTPKDLALPGSAEVRIGDILGFSHHAIPHVKKAFEKRGYHVSVGMSSLDLRTGVANLGVLWLSTHGLRDCQDVDGKDHFCLAADVLDTTKKKKCVLSTPADCFNNDKDLIAGNAAYFVGETNSYYAINEKWVSSYWTFGSHALVFIDGCNSLIPFANGGGVETSQVQPFTNVLRSKGVGTVMGWSGVVSADMADASADFFFDRVLGGNKDKVTPPQRPFSAQEVYAAMRARDLITDRNNKDAEGAYTTLRLYPLDPNGPDLILAPSIQVMTVGDPATDIQQRLTEQASGTQLFIDGEFGVDQGTVEVEGGSLGTWDQRRIAATIGTTSKGAVVVKVPRGGSTITSNAAPLTSWRGNVTFNDMYNATLGGDAATKLDCAKLHMRADIHPFRLAPETRAVAGTVTAGIVDPTVMLRNAVADTSCTGTISGTLSGVMTLETQTKSISWQPSNQTSAQGAWYFLITGKIDTKLRRVTVLPAYTFCTTGIVHTPKGDIRTATDAVCEALDNLSGIAPGNPFGSMPQGQFDPTWSNATLNAAPNCMGDTCNVDYSLTVEIPSAPSTDTEG